MMCQVLRSGIVIRALQSCDKVKSTKCWTLLTRTFTSGIRSPNRRRFTTTLIVCGAIGGTIGAEVLLWGYKYRDASQVTKAACCQDNQDKAQTNHGGTEESSSGGNNDAFEARLKVAIAQSRDLLHRAKDEYGAPGIVAAVSVNGQCLWSEGLGYSDVENRVPCTPSTVHRIASISKSFTMVAVAKLMEEGKLDIDKVVQEYVPKFPEKTWEGEEVKITTRQLLSHMSGLRHYNREYIKSNQHKSTKNDNTPPNMESNDKSVPSADNLAQKKDKKNQSNMGTKDRSASTEKSDKKKDESKMSDSEKKGDERFREFYVAGNCDSVTRALDIFKDDPLVHPPGSKFLYTTYGWTLISAVVEAAGGRPFLKQMADIFKDLDMMHTVPDEHIPIIYNRARGYSYNKCGRLVNTPHVNLSLKWAGGGYLSTVNDLIKFGNAMLYSYQYTNSHKDRNLPPGYLRPETMATIWKPVSGTKGSWDIESKYAMGWAVVERDQTHGQCRKTSHLLSHTGGAVGFSSVLLISPSIKDEVNGNRNETAGDSPPNGVVVAMITNLGATSLYKTAVKIGDIFREV